MENIFWSWEDNISIRLFFAESAETQSMVRLRGDKFFLCFSCEVGQDSVSRLKSIMWPAELGSALMSPTDSHQSLFLGFSFHGLLSLWWGLNKSITLSAGRQDCWALRDQDGGTTYQCHLVQSRDSGSHVDHQEAWTWLKEGDWKQYNIQKQHYWAVIACSKVHML